jgi:hypothetical protein
MRMHRFLLVLSGLSFLLRATAAPAFLDPPYITPASPTAGDLISVNIYGGECDLVDMGIVLPPITQQGNAITIPFHRHSRGRPGVVLLPCRHFDISGRDFSTRILHTRC